MFWHKEPDIKYYMCTINKTFAKPGHDMIQYTKDNLLDYIDPNNDTLMIRLADARLHIECRIMLGTDKRATITTSWSEFCRCANIREGDICAFHFRVTSKRRVFLPCTASRSTIEDTAVPV
ncbi:hypothetical protein VPH35_065190 [Triticum aestivum]|uniref:TF-B3 domain-containing protein n=1 Tax=Triticum aestivum TaxID=4565 RepID=A0A3B6HQD0_WHEAT